MSKIEELSPFNPNFVSREELRRLIELLEEKLTHPDGFSKTTRRQMLSAKRQLESILFSAKSGAKIPIKQRQLEFCKKKASKTPNAVHYGYGHSGASLRW